MSVKAGRNMRDAIEGSSRSLATQPELGHGKVCCLVELNNALSFKRARPAGGGCLSVLRLLLHELPALRHPLSPTHAMQTGPLVHCQNCRRGKPAGRVLEDWLAPLMAGLGSALHSLCSDAVLSRGTHAHQLLELVSFPSAACPQ